MGFEAVRFFLDSFDIEIYFRESAWILTSQPPHSDLPFGYPPLARLVFAAFRYLSNLLIGPSDVAFGVLWIAASAVLLGLAVLWSVRSSPTTRWWAIAIWLAPASLYFALYRFDIYPVFATLAAYYLIREKRLLAGSLLLGIAIALKGYAVYLLPAIYYFVAANRGHRTALAMLAAAIAPMVASIAAFTVLAGLEETLKPFTAQAMRGFNGESSYDAIAALSGVNLVRHAELGGWSRVVQLAQWGAAFGVLLTRPTTFKALVAASLFVLVAFISLSPYYSPQYILWLLPLACLLEDRFASVATIAMGWITYLYFPVAYDTPGGKEFWVPLFVLLLLIARLALSGRTLVLATRAASPIAAQARGAQRKRR